MFARHIRQAGLALAALALATSINITPAADAATLPADQAAVEVCTGCRILDPDLEVFNWQTKKVDGKFIYYFKVHNRGSLPANNVVLYKDVQVNNWYDNFGTVTATQYNRPTPVAPGETFGVQIECPANNTTKYCDWASLEVKVLGTPDDPNPVNDYAKNNTNSRGY
jgi:hypothetical protein